MSYYSPCNYSPCIYNYTVVLFSYYTCRQKNQVQGKLHVVYITILVWSSHTVVSWPVVSWPVPNKYPTYSLSMASLLTLVHCSQNPEPTLTRTRSRPRQSRHCTACIIVLHAYIACKMYVMGEPWINFILQKNSYFIKTYHAGTLALHWPNQTVVTANCDGKLWRRADCCSRLHAMPYMHNYFLYPSLRVWDPASKARCFLGPL